MRAPVRAELGMRTLSLELMVLFEATQTQVMRE